MYISLDELPPLSEGYVKKKHQEVLESKTLYEFKLIRQMPTDFVLYSMMVCFLIFAFWVVTSLGDMSLFSGLMVFMVAAIPCAHAYYAHEPDIEQTVRLTEKGLIQTEITLLPDSYYTFLRYSGFLGIGIGVVSVLILGPWALVGPGAGIFAAFKMYKVKNVPSVQVCPFNSDIQYEVYPASAVRYKHNLKELRFSPNIVMEEERPQLFRRNRNFYSIDFAINEEVKYRLFQQLEKIVNVVEVEEFRTPDAS